MPSARACTRAVSQTTDKCVDVSREISGVPLRREHHHHESPGAHILDVMSQVLELGAHRASDQRALKLRKYSVLAAGRIQSTQILRSVKNVDGVTIEAGGH